MKIRHCGLHAPANATTKLETARRVLEATRPTVSDPAPPPAEPTEPPPVEDWRTLLRRLTGIDPTRCKRCGGTLKPTSLSLPPCKAPDDTS